jgi:hypothetical protein
MDSMMRKEAEQRSNHTAGTFARTNADPTTREEGKNE